MTEIPYDEEFTSDWDWYAVDCDGNLGHFATAGFRRLPLAVKRNFEGAERSTQYFFNEAPRRSGHSVRSELEQYTGRFRSKKKLRYLESFAKMSEKGLFSFDTKLAHDFKEYFQVTIPLRPLKCNDISADIWTDLCIVQADLLLPDAVFIEEVRTLSWPAANSLFAA